MQNFITALTPLAYIDGGSASMFFQAAIGALLAGSFFFSSKLGQAWSFIKSALNRNKSNVK